MDVKPKEYNVVLTGFGPFEDVLENESWLAVSKLAEMKWPNRIKLVTCELYVDYKVVKEQVKSLWSNEMPDLMIHVGVDREATKISIERCAFNDGYIDADVSGNCPHGNICVENGSNTLNTKLNVERILEASNKIFKQKYPVCDASNDPGRYLCGFTYYFSLHQDNSKSLFVHVPSKECLTLEEMAISLRAVIFDSLDQLYGYKV